MITVKCTLTKEDYINYYTYVRWDAPDQKKSKIKYYLRHLLINAGLIAVLFYTDIFRFNRIYLYAYGGIVLISAVTQLLFARSNIKKQAERMAEDTDNRSFFLDTLLEISENGIVQKDEQQESKLLWKAFIRKDENAGYYFLFTSSIHALILPKRIFKTADDKLKFEKLLVQHLSFDAEVAHLIKE